jgi:hypothetical protein
MNKLLLLVVLGAAAVGIYFFMNPSQTEGLLTGTPLAPDSALTRVYKWQDGQGQWHVTDLPPPEGIDYELKEYRAEVIPLALPPAAPQ